MVSLPPLAHSVEHLLGILYSCVQCASMAAEKELVACAEAAERTTAEGAHSSHVGLPALLAGSREDLLE